MPIADALPRIETVGPESGELVFDTVLKLVRELGEEADDLGELDRARVRQAWEKSADRLTVFVARDAAGEVLGLLTLSESFAIYANGAYGEINEMYVAPASRSHGVGRMLVAAAKAHGRSRGWRRIDVTCPESARWTRTRTFYEREGFTFTGPKLKFLLE